jgi:MinD-like ATPase involved in chromosome partitioning or flagellar assembly
MGGVLDAAHTLVIAGSPTLDGASRASKTLDWLLAHGYRHLVEGAVVALSNGRASRHIDTGAIREHFAGRCHAVIDIPLDPHLAIRRADHSRRTTPGTRDAFLQLAAHVAEQFSW